MGFLKYKHKNIKLNLNILNIPLSKKKYPPTVCAAEIWETAAGEWKASAGVEIIADCADAIFRGILYLSAGINFLKAGVLQNKEII